MLYIAINCHYFANSTGVFDIVFRHIDVRACDSHFRKIVQIKHLYHDVNVSGHSPS